MKPDITCSLRMVILAALVLTMTVTRSYSTPIRGYPKISDLILSQDNIAQFQRQFRMNNDYYDHMLSTGINKYEKRLTGFN